MKNFKNWLTVMLLITSVTVFSQTTLSGKVVDETNQPLPGATVVIQGSKVGASSDFDGNFSFETSMNSGTLVVSFIGFESKSV
ncbi:MAG: carboxypeptidase-like regulatory domain-containing protein, partial [Bacteroidetes bacterium]|nr:carboxypeptidase-like regulatory domain-containing protein [Bacteroidota bacterium]